VVGVTVVVGDAGGVLAGVVVEAGLVVGGVVEPGAVPVEAAGTADTVVGGEPGPV
jgi:hypothetical protein